MKLRKVIYGTGVAFRAVAVFAWGYIRRVIVPATLLVVFAAVVIDEVIFGAVGLVGVDTSAYGGVVEGTANYLADNTNLFDLAGKVMGTGALMIFSGLSMMLGFFLIRNRAYRFTAQLVASVGLTLLMLPNILILGLLAVVAAVAGSVGDAALLTPLCLGFALPIIGAGQLLRHSLERWLANSATLSRIEPHLRWRGIILRRERSARE